MRGLARPSAPNPIIIPNSKRSESAAADHLRRLIGNKIRPTSFHNQASGWVGEKDLACEQLATAVRCPTSGMELSYGQLKLMPWWDPLRGEPCFEKIVASLAPK
jgi:hypothetical protein